MWEENKIIIYKKLTKTISLQFIFASVILSGCHAGKDTQIQVPIDIQEHSLSEEMRALTRSVSLEQEVEPILEVAEPIPEIEEVIEEYVIPDCVDEEENDILVRLTTRADRKVLQRALREAGYQVGSIDGYLGKKTYIALKQYQEKHEMSGEGKLTQDTLSSLGISEAVSVIVIEEVN